MYGLRSTYFPGSPLARLVCTGTDWFGKSGEGRPLLIGFSYVRIPSTFAISVLFSPELSEPLKRTEYNFSSGSNCRHYRSTAPYRDILCRCYQIKYAILAAPCVNSICF